MAGGAAELAELVAAKGVACACEIREVGWGEVVVEEEEEVEKEEEEEEELSRKWDANHRLARATARAALPAQRLQPAVTAQRSIREDFRAQTR